MLIKNIQKTKRLVILEREVDLFTAVQAYLDQEATGSLTPEVEINKPEYKVYIGYKKENVSQIMYNKKLINNLGC